MQSWHPTHPPGEQGLGPPPPPRGPQKLGQSGYRRQDQPGREGAPQWGPVVAPPDTSPGHHTHMDVADIPVDSKGHFQDPLSPSRRRPYVHCPHTCTSALQS